MDNERLLRLADLLEADAARSDGVKFNLSHVVCFEQRPEDGIVKVDCGTHACAMGLAAISGAFEDEGLGYRLGICGFAVTLYGEAREWSDAASRVFGLAMNEVDFLFTPCAYQQTQGAEAERMVASRIRDMVAGDVVAPDDPMPIEYDDDDLVS